VSLRVINPGLCSTVQDSGRAGYREWGVPLSGAFDQASFNLANALLGNPPGAAAVEMTLVGGVYEALVPLAIALTGAPMEACVESRQGIVSKLQIPQTVQLGAGERLILRGSSLGARAYLAVKGGFLTPLILSSRSSEVRLKAGEVLLADPGTTLVRRPSTSLVAWADDEVIRVIDGPDAHDDFDCELWDRLTFLVASQSDRMGLRLEGPELSVPSDPERVSMPVAPGAVQVAGRRVIILGVACGTMGGYPHVAQVVSADLDRLGQARPGNPLRLRRIELDEARELDRADRRERNAWLAQAVSRADAEST